MTMEDFSMADKHNASSNFSIPNRPIVRALENEFMRPSRLGEPEHRCFCAIFLDQAGFCKDGAS